MIRNLLEDTSLYDNTVNSILYRSPPTFEDIGKEYYILEETQNGKYKCGLLNCATLYSIINKIDPLTQPNLNNSQALVFVCYVSELNRYIYIYNHNLIFESIEKARAYCGVCNMDIYFGASIAHK